MSAIRYSWNEQESTKSFEISLAPCSREPKSWKEEIYAAAREITNRTRKPIWICSSGGLASEVVCRAFFDQGINFSVLTLEHVAGTNRRETQFVMKWCRERGIRHEVVKIDIPTFLAKDIDAYATRYVAEHPLRYVQLKLLELVEEMNGYAVLGWRGPPFEIENEKTSNTRKDVYLQWNIGTATTFQWCEDNNAEHEPFFFSSTSELCLSYIKNPLVSFALNNPDTVFRHKSNAYLLRRIIFQSCWPDIEMRYQYNGFENMQSLLQETIARLSRKFGKKFQSYRMPLLQYEQDLLGEDRFLK